MQKSIHNFTTELKRELLKNAEQTDCCRRATIAGFLSTTAQLHSQNGENGFQFMTESEQIAEYFLNAIEDCFSLSFEVVEAKIDNRNGRERLIFQALSARAVQILKELALLQDNIPIQEQLPLQKNILFASKRQNVRDLKENQFYFNSLELQFPAVILQNVCCKKAYCIGAFLGSGSCSLPTSKNNGYHLEFVFYRKVMAESFADLLYSCDILPKLVERKNSYVVYIKSRESICDFLAFFEVENALKKFDQITQIRDTNNKINRWTNCKLGNMDKTITASIQQVQAIENIENSIGIYSLDATLQQVALARLQDKNCTMQELADKLQLTKSCLNHRMRKLMQIAKLQNIEK